MALVKFLCCWWTRVSSVHSLADDIGPLLIAAVSKMGRGAKDPGVRPGGMDKVPSFVRQERNAATVVLIYPSRSHPTDKRVRSMTNPMVKFMIAASLLSSAFLANSQASAQTKPPATATRPGSPEQTSIPNNAPPATRTQTTGQTNPDPTVRKMNENEKRKIEIEGK